MARGEEAPWRCPPEKLVYLLEHAYTPAELGFAALKGADAAVAGVLTEAAQQAQCDLHLALLTVAESGAAEYAESYGSRRGRWGRGDAEEDEFEAGEVFDRNMTLSDWRRLDGSTTTLGDIPVEAEEFLPPDACDELEPDEEHFREATGNEGASFERTYRRAALVLWPSDRVFAVLSQAGLPVTLPYLDDLARRWADSGGDRQSLSGARRTTSPGTCSRNGRAGRVSAPGRGPERCRPNARSADPAGRHGADRAVSDRGHRCRAL